MLAQRELVIEHCASYEVVALSASTNVPDSGLSGAILAGGVSQRMGRDKAMTPVPGTGRTMLESVLMALSTVTEDIVIVAPPRAGYEQYGVPLITDASGPVGPLRGIAAALRAVAHDRCFVLACDLPYVDARLLAWMAALDTDAEALIPMVNGASRQGGAAIYQTLHAIYRRSCLAAMELCLDNGDPRTTTFLRAVRFQAIPEASLRTIDPKLRSFTNVNAPADLQKF